MPKLTKIKSKDRGLNRDQFMIILEAIQSDFRAFGEKLDFIDERLSGQLRGVDAQLDKIKVRLDKIESALIEIRAEISDLKIRLDKKADLERLIRLEERVRQIEAVLTVLSRKGQGGARTRR